MSTPKSPPRIGYYLSLPPIRGGIERHVLALIDHFRERHHVAVFCDPVDDSHPFHLELGARGISPHFIRRRVKETRGVVRALAKNLPAILYTHSLLAAARLDVLHFHAGRLGSIYAPIAASCIAGIPNRILTMHNSFVSTSRVQRSIEGRVLGHLHHVVAVCDAVRQELATKKDLAAEKIALIPNGVDLAEFELAVNPREIKAELGLPVGSLVIGMVGRLHQVKGADLLIRAAALIRERLPQFRVVLIGEGPEEQRLKRLAEERAVSDIVIFAGYRRDARRLMQGLDLLVAPSRQEAQSFALMEAMACGKPVVASNVGGIPGVLVDGVTGLLVPTEDFGALADAVVKLLGDPKKMADMGRAGRRRVQAHFSQAAMLEKTGALYKASRSRLTQPVEAESIR
jgi:glycosyltransferase involved in cell wall biosynthesis